MTVQLRALRAEGRYAEAIAHYRHLITTGEVDAEAHLIGGQAAKAIGDFLTARDALESALDSAPTGAVLGTVRFVLGTVWVHLGDYFSAVELLTLWLAELPSYPDLAGRLRGAALYNRGLAYRSARRYGDSLLDYTDACEEFRREGAKDYLRQALQNLAWVACVLGYRMEAEEALEEARPLCASADAQWRQLLAEVFLGAIPDDPATLKAQQQHAVGQCRNILTQEKEGPDGPPVEVLSQASWLAGWLYLRLGQFEAAEEFVRKALDYATAAMNDTRCLYDAADLLRQIHQTQHSSQPRKAGGSRE